MHFSPSEAQVRDSGVSSVLEHLDGTLSSCILYTLRFAALASCFTLAPALTSMDGGNAKGLSGTILAMQSYARGFLALTKKSLFLEDPENKNFILRGSE